MDASTDPQPSSVPLRRKPSGTGWLPWLIGVSLAVHVLLLVILQPWASTTMGVDKEENAQRAELVSEREKVRKQMEDERRQRMPIPERYRDQLKKEAERKERLAIRDKVRQMMRDREEALRQRERAFDELRKRDQDEYVKRHVVPRILNEDHFKRLDETVKQFNDAKPEDKKTDADKAFEERAREAARKLKEAVKDLEESPTIENAKKKLDEINEQVSELKEVSNKGRDRGKESGEPAWKLGHAGNQINDAVKEARKDLKEAQDLHDTSDAEEIGDAPEAAKQAAGEGSEASQADGEDAMEGGGEEGDQNTVKRADKQGGEASSQGGGEESQQGGGKQANQQGDEKSDKEGGEKSSSSKSASKSGGQGGQSSSQPSTADLYNAAKTLEKQTEAAVNDARAAEMAQRADTSFGTAKGKLNNFSPDRPDLTKPLSENNANTVGELNEYRDALQQANSQVTSMALRTEQMTRGVESMQSRRAANAGRMAMLAAAASGRGYGDITGGMSFGGSSFGEGYGDSSNMDRMGVPGTGGGNDDREGKTTGELELPQKMIMANALPGRMLTDVSARKGWLYLDTWYVIGPWDVQYKNKFDITHPPEYEIDFDAVYTDGKFKDRPDHPYHDMRWQFMQSDQIKLQTPEVFGGETWYAYTEVYSDRTRDMLLAVASDDFAKVWLNDQVVWQDDQQSAFNMGEALRKVTFHQGYNRILVRIGNGPGPLIWSVLISPPEVLDYLQSEAEGQ